MEKYPGIQTDKSTQLHSHAISRLGSNDSLLAYIFSHYQKNNSTVQYGTTLTSHVPIDTTVNPFNPPEENNDEDEKAMRSLFNETMNGPEGKKLSKSYDGERGQTT